MTHIKETAHFCVRLSTCQLQTKKKIQTYVIQFKGYHVTFYGSPIGSELIYLFTYLRVLFQSDMFNCGKYPYQIFSTQMSTYLGEQKCGVKSNMVLQTTMSGLFL